MARKGTIEREKSLKVFVSRQRNKRFKLKNIIMDRSSDPETRFKAQMKLSSLPRDGSKTRMRNRCEITGRARGCYQKFRLSRIMLREMAASGLIPGIRKASW
jgi:small subunit ribosomal protein S14